MMTGRRPFEFDNFVVAGENAAVLDLSVNRPEKTEARQIAENIVTRLDLLLDEEKNNNLKLIRMILQQLSPLLLEKQSLEIVSRFVAEHFPALGDKKVLDFYFHPDTVYQVRPLVEQLASQNGFAGQIFLHRDASLPRCDCRIRWQGGGAGSDSREKIRRLTAMLTGEEDE